MGSLWRGLKWICSLVQEHAPGTQGRDEQDLSKGRHRAEVRRRRINKLENMKETAVLDGDEDLYEYTQKRLATLKRLEQEAELIRLSRPKDR